jgi:uncharacterized protein involved in exopolysaccharide biosynthesis
MIAVTAVHFEFLHLVPREYYAEAMFQRKNDVVMDVTGGSIIAQQISPIRQAIQENIRGRAAIEQLITDLNLSGKYNMPRKANGELTAEGQMAMNDLIAKIQRQMTFNALGLTEQSDQYVITYIDDEPIQAAKVVNTLIENYINKTHQELASRLLQAQTFFETEDERYATLVRDLDEKLVRFAESNHRFEIGDDDPHAVHTKLDDAVKKRDELAGSLGAHKAERAARQKAYNDMPDTVPVTAFEDNPEMLRLRAQQVQLGTEIETMRQQGLKDEHPRLHKTLERQAVLSDQIDRTQEKRQVLRGEEPNVQKIELKQQLDLLNAQVAELEGQFDAARANVDDLDRLNRNFYQVKREYTQLQRDLADARDQQKFWDANLSRTVKDIAAERAQRGLRLSFIRRATSDPRPHNPSWQSIALKVFAAGVVAALALIVVVELLDRSYRSIDHAVDDLRLPILGAVNEIVTPAQALRRRILNLGVFPAAAALLGLLFLVSWWVVLLSLREPQKYDQLRHDPKQYISQTLLGHA